MKTNSKILTFAMIAAFAVSSCGKHALPPKPEATQTPNPAETVKKDDGKGNEKEKEQQVTDGGTTPVKGQFDVGGKNNVMDGIKNVITAKPEEIVAKLQAIDARFGEKVEKEVILTVNSAYVPAQKNLKIKKGLSTLRSVSVNEADSKVSMLKPTDAKAKIEATLGGQDLSLVWDEKANQYSSDKDIEVKDVVIAKPLSIVLKPVADVQFKTEAESTLEIAPIVVLEDAEDKPIAKITLDDSTDKILVEDVKVSSSSDDKDDDAQCTIYAPDGIGETKPILFNKVISLKDDGSLDFTAVKNDIKRIPVGIMEAQIVCMKASTKKSPNIISTTIGSTLKIEVKHAAPAASKSSTTEKK